MTFGPGERRVRGCRQEAEKEEEEEASASFVHKLVTKGGLCRSFGNHRPL